MSMPRSGEIEPKHVVILGAGFGGLYAARALRRAPVRVTLIDQRNHHLFHPVDRNNQYRSQSESHEDHPEPQVRLYPR